MQLKVKRDRVGQKFRVEIRAEYTPDEKAKIASFKLQWERIYGVATSNYVKDVTKPSTFMGDVFLGMFPEFKGYAVNVTVNSIECGHVFEASDLEILFKLKSEIKEGCKHLQTRLDATDLYRGQEQVVDLRGED